MSNKAHGFGLGKRKFTFVSGFDKKSHQAHIWQLDQDPKTDSVYFHKQHFGKGCQHFQIAYIVRSMRTLKDFSKMLVDTSTIYK